MRQVWGQLPDQAELEVRVKALELRTASMAAELTALHAAMLDVSRSLSEVKALDVVPGARLAAG